MNTRVGRYIKVYKKLDKKSLHLAYLALGSYRWEKTTDADKWTAVVFIQQLSAPVKHSLACLRSRRDDADRAAGKIQSFQDYKEQHVHSCDKCGGTGYHYDAGYWDAKAGVGEPPNYEPCESCFAQGYCPCCGEQAWDEEGEFETCPKCGWNEKKGPFQPVGRDFMEDYFHCVSGCPAQRYNW